MAKGDHGAASSAAGYLYQTYWALLELLRRGHDRPDQTMTLEMHDDVAWEVDGSATELLQTKLHANTAAGLGDKHPDIWRTLKVWIDRSDVTDPMGPELALVTTSVAPEGTAAHALRPEALDVAFALEQLVAAATSSTSKETADARSAFLRLGHAGRLALVSRVRVLDGAVPLDGIDAAIRNELLWVIPGNPEQGRLFLAAVWKWWVDVSVDMLQRRRKGVEIGEVRQFIDELRDHYTSDNLPTTIDLADVSDSDIAAHLSGRFVRQMELVKYPGGNLRRAIVDYHRAITQETAWLDTDLIGTHELRRFEENLRDEWARAFEDMLDDLSAQADLTDEMKAQAGKTLLRALLDSSSVSVRLRYNDPFFARGKRHDLANRAVEDGGIGWHPDFAVRVEAVLAGSGGG